MKENFNYIEFKTKKGEFIIVNFPNIEEIEEFYGDIYCKQNNNISWNIIPNPKKEYLKLIGKANELSSKTIFEQIENYNFNSISEQKFLDSILNHYYITINKELKNNKFKFFENPYIIKRINEHEVV